MNSDFSRLNLEYLIQARDLVIADPHRAGVILGIPDVMTRILSDLTPPLLTDIIRIKHPLVVLRRDVWWWSRLLVALQEGQTAEIETVAEQASLILSATTEKVNR
ncbi:MAG: flagellar transcriptional regulator FlhD [Gammaproteobacteria bacterium]|nr:flagellar transcriptional regulator FlhD [Gammaproteobacteria bacterium]